MSSEVAHISWPLICLSGCICKGSASIIVGAASQVPQVPYLVNGLHIPLLLLLVIGCGSRNAIIVCWHALVDRGLSSGILTRAICEERTVIFVVHQQLLSHAFTRAAGHSTYLSLGCAQILLLLLPSFEGLLLGGTHVRHMLRLYRWHRPGEHR